MNFLRFLVVTGVLAATMSTAPDDVAAQSLTIDDTVAVPSNWMSGYMGLGGGLAKAMPKNEAKKTASSAPERLAARRPPPQAAPRVVHDRSTPASLIAETLDHTGENVATLGTRASVR